MPYAPIFLPPEPPPSPEVLAAERAILDAEGPVHVAGCYYADEDTAARARRYAAQELVRETARREAWARVQAQRTGTHAPAHATPGVVAPALRIAAWLTPRERTRIEAACTGHTVLACDSITRMREMLALDAADVALVSAALVEPAHVAPLTALAEGMPAGTVIGLVADADEPRALAGALRLGRAGLAVVVDVRTPAGWADLRRALAPRALPDAFMRAALAAIVVELRTPDAREGADNGAGEGSDDVVLPAGLLAFFRAIFAPDVHSAKQIAARLGVLPSTLTSRFFRAGLPSPKRYLTMARLAWAAHLAESPARSLADVAHRLDASSPQAFGRTVRLVMGVTGAEFRRAFDGPRMLDHFRATLVAPYRARLRAFDPLAIPRDQPSRATAAARGSYVTNDRTGRAA